LINLFGPWLTKVCTLQYIDAGLLRAFFSEGRVMVYDTLRHWALSVRAMGDLLHYAKLPRDSQSVSYCRRDTEITHRFVRIMLAQYQEQGLSLRPTLPGMAFQLFKSLYPYEPEPFPSMIKTLFREGYYGGRVEVYQTGKIHGPINHYDINSLFPYVMRESVFPRLDSWRRTDAPNFKREGIVRARLSCPMTMYPCLPVRAKDEILYPYGELVGVWTYPEIRQALKDGAKIQGVGEAIEFDSVCRPFISFVELCYNKRLAAESDFERLHYKLLMNSLYGKFGAKGALITIKDDRERVMHASGNSANIIWSAYTTAYARLKLLALLRGCETVYYTDTDSVFTPREQPVSTDIGALKRVGVYTQAEFLGNKVYCVQRKPRGAWEGKARGVPKHQALDYIRTGKCVFSRPMRLRESRVSLVGQPNIWYPMTKVHRRKYAKRNVQRDGSTLPWAMADYRRVVSEK